MRLSRLPFCPTLAILLAASSSVFADRLVRCESENYNYQRCPADTQDGVELRRQLSDTEYRQAENWGYDRRGI